MAEQLVVEEASKVYPDGNHALRGPSFTVGPGTFMVLLGPSGSGKTTLLRSLAGIERLSSGRIVIGTTVVADDKTHLPPERRDLAMVFQDYALWPHLTARDNVAFALRRRRLSRHAARSRAMDILERVGLGHLGDRFPTQLSGGEQQRVALARALVADTGLLLCDEPLSNLDADLRERMRVEISSLVREAGATTIYITHDQLEAFALADRVGVLQDGVLVQLGTPEEIYSSPGSLFIARFTGLSCELDVRVTGDGFVPGHVQVVPTAFRSVRPIEVRLATGDTRELGSVAIRPTAVRLCDPDGGSAHFVGHVADTAFRGRHYELVVDLPASHRVSGVVSERRVPRGTVVGLELEAAGCLLFGASDNSPSDPPGVPTASADQSSVGDAAVVCDGPKSQAGPAALSEHGSAAGDEGDAPAGWTRRDTMEPRTANRPRARRVR
ncbi:MAG: ABC transporter ATP-binding protein [Actinomycetota bacterium]|nr:ABC transporter ATP-binding protein [Actinomycetota bacterium]